MKTQQEVSNLQAGRGLAPKLNHVGTLILAFQPPELWEIHFGCLQAKQFVVFCYSSLKRLREHMKRWSTLIAIRDIQLKTMIRYYHTPNRMMKIKYTRNSKYCQVCGATRYSKTSLVGMQNGIATLENSLAVSYKIKHTLTIWSSNPRPRYLLKKWKHISTQNTVHKCLAVLLIITHTHTQNGKQSKYPLTSKWLKTKCGTFFTMEYYSR